MSFMLCDLQSEIYKGGFSQNIIYIKVMELNSGSWNES